MQHWSTHDTPGHWKHEYDTTSRKTAAEQRDGTCIATRGINPKNQKAEKAISDFPAHRNRGLLEAIGEAWWTEARESDIVQFSTYLR